MTAGQVNREIGKRVYITLFALYLLFPVRVQSQDAKHEFRGAWIATVINLDWPSEASFDTNQQKGELVSMMDQLGAAGINALFFQIRSEAWGHEARGYRYVQRRSRAEVSVIRVGSVSGGRTCSFVPEPCRWGITRIYEKHPYDALNDFPTSPSSRRCCSCPVRHVGRRGAGVV